MKKVMKSAVVALALALSLSFGAGVTANAAKVTVKSVKSVDKLTGKGSKKNKIVLAKGKKAKLKTTVTVTPNKKANKGVTYKTSNKKIATVKNGVITAKKKGTATITVTSKKNKKKTAKVYVKVVNGKVTKLSVDKSAVELTAGASDVVTATVKTSGKSPNTTLKATSSNKDVATVSVSKKKITVNAVAEGTAKITVQSTDGTNKKTTFEVKVNKQTTTLAVTGTVNASVVVKDATKAAADFDLLVKAANLKDTDSATVTVNGKAYAKTVAEVKARLKTVKKNDTVKISVAAAEANKFSLAAALTAAPGSISSITIDGVTFTDITPTTFKVGTTTYTYTVSGKNVVVDGHVAAAFDKLVKAKTITATEN